MAIGKGGKSKFPALIFCAKGGDYMEIKERIHDMVENRRKTCTQKEVAEMTGVSRSHIANFERGIVNNMYLYDFYLNKFGGSRNAD